ncbi:MAG: GntR family transcriptional regulator [Synergistaceae bacterium]|jgi:DNA-binding GntR family transcriptional regulator|nr:GntR family transcriptional regulator [Synergistaceae bacterium]
MGTKTFLSFGEQIYQTLKERILSNYYAPGTLLQIEKLAAEMGVSSTPIRETLFKLHSIGLVNIVRNKGALVSGIDAVMARNVWQFRMLLETFVAREAVPNIQAADLKNLKTTIEGYLENLSDFDLYQRIDRELHLLLCDNAENDLVKEALKNLLDQSRRVRYFAESHPPVEDILITISQEHMAIVEALESRDPDAVVRALEHHLAQGEKRVLRALEKHKL